MSDASSELGADGRKRTVENLVERLQKKALTPRLSLSAHLSIGRTLCKLRDAIINEEAVSANAATSLLCCGINLYRRHTIADAEEEDDDSEETITLVKKSTVLIFVLLAAIEARNSGLVDLQAVDHVVKTANESTLANVFIPKTKKRKGIGLDARDATDAPNANEARAIEISEWEQALAISPGELTLNVLKLVSNSIAFVEGSEHERLSDLFFRSSAACMAHNILLASGTENFVSLKAVGTNDIPKEQRLLAIVQAGESEAGQSCLRDLLLSFLLPSSIVGVRRNLLMSRSASTAAGIEYADSVNQAHSVAMAGTEYIWQHGTDTLERACALLAGIAVLTTRGGDDPIRKLDAFLGRISLPFLETTSPAPGVKRLVLLPDRRRWILYKIDKKNQPTVLCNLSGFEGLCDCVLEFV